MIMLKIFCLSLTLVTTMALDSLPDKDLYVCEHNRMNSHKKGLDHDDFPIDDRFRYDTGMKKKSSNRRGDVYYVVPSNQPKQRSSKRPDYMMDMIKDYPNHHADYLSEMIFPQKSKRPEPDFAPKFSNKFEPLDDHKYPPLDDHKFPPMDDHKYPPMDEPKSEPEYRSKFEPLDEPKYGGYEPEEMKYGTKFLPEPIAEMKSSKNVYINEGEEEGKHKDDLGRYEHYEPYEPKRRQPVRPTFQRSHFRDEPKNRQYGRHHDFSFYSEEVPRKPSKRPQPQRPPPIEDEEEEYECDCS